MHMHMCVCLMDSQCTSYSGCFGRPGGQGWKQDLIFIIFPFCCLNFIPSILLLQDVNKNYMLYHMSLTLQWDKKKKKRMSISDLSKEEKI